MTDEPVVAPETPVEAPQEPEPAPEQETDSGGDVCPVCGLRGRPEGHH